MRSGKGLSTDSINLAEKALKAFEKYWRDNATSEDIRAVDSWTGMEDMRGYNTAAEMIYNYIEERRAMLTSRDLRLLDVERPFAVPLNEDGGLLYVGRLDKVFKLAGSIFVMEHKTSSMYKKDGPFQNTFVESFSPNSQVDGYLYSANLLYGRDLKAVWIDAALVHKTVHDGFKIIPIDRKLAQLSAWLWETHYYIGQIRANINALEKLRASGRNKGEYLAAFPKDTSRCTDFGLCPYINLCKMWGNPEQFSGAPPEFHIEKWEPFNELELRKKKTTIIGSNAVVTGKEELYDNTRIQDSRRCLRYYYFRHVRFFVSDGDRRALLFGGAWHAAQDVIWTTLAKKE